MMAFVSVLLYFTVKCLIQGIVRLSKVDLNRSQVIMFINESDIDGCEIKQLRLYFQEFPEILSNLSSSDQSWPQSHSGRNVGNMTKL